MWRTWLAEQRSWLLSSWKRIKCLIKVGIIIIFYLDVILQHKVSWCWDPLVRRLRRHLYRPRADWSHPRVTEVDWCSAGQPRLSVKRRPGRRNEWCLITRLPWLGVFPQLKDKCQGIIQTGHSPPTQIMEAISQSDPNHPGCNSQTSIQPKFLTQMTNCLMGSSSHQWQ
jgi:hypothetical protein